MCMCVPIYVPQRSRKHVYADGIRFNCISFGCIQSLYRRFIARFICSIDLRHRDGQTLNNLLTFRQSNSTPLSLFSTFCCFLVPDDAALHLFFFYLIRDLEKQLVSLGIAPFLLIYANPMQKFCIAAYNQIRNEFKMNIKWRSHIWNMHRNADAANGKNEAEQFMK